MAILEPELDHPAYHAQVKLRYYNYPVSVFQAVTDTDAAKILRRLNPEWTKQDHATLAQRHREAAQRQSEAWNRLLNEAAEQTFGRPYRVTDYRVSGIACDEFSDAMKTQLRFAAHATTYHKRASSAHARAARTAPNALQLPP